MIHRDIKTGQKLDVAGLNEITVIIDRSETKLSEVALNRWTPGLAGPPHKHEQKEQLFFVISGEGDIKIGEELFPAKQGGLYYVPANVIHQTINHGKTTLDYLLFNAFLNNDKEGHASFAEHVDHMKNTRLAQAIAQRADVGAFEPMDSSNVNGKYFQSVSSFNFDSSRKVSQPVLLPKQETQRSEAALFYGFAGISHTFEMNAFREQTLFILSGSGTFTGNGEPKDVKYGDIVFLPSGSKCDVNAGPSGIKCLALSAVF